MESDDQLTAHAIDWNVTIERRLETPTSMLAFGVTRDTHVVLKVSKREGDEWYSGEVLRAFAGNGAVRVLECDAGAVLLERLEPATQLVELVRAGQDEEATKIIANVMRQLANRLPPEHCPTVLDWARGFDRYLSTNDKQISSELVTEARDLYLHLERSQKSSVLLHGDLQHYNVLFDSKRGWVAIDPKGVVGELEYEVGASLRNPVEVPDLFTSPDTIHRRLNILTTALGLDYTRALSWSFAQAVLSAIWDVEDGYPVEPNHPVLKLAHTIRSLL